jgi:hypothetical protein
MTNLRRRAGLLLVALGVLVLASTTYGVTSIVADRVTDVQTAGQDEAYLSLASSSSCDPGCTVDETTGGTSVLIVANRFEQRLDSVTVEVVGTSGSTVGADDLKTSPVDRLSPRGETGDSADVALRCAEANGEIEDDLDVDVRVEASGTDVSVEATTTLTGVDVDCPSN